MTTKCIGEFVGTFLLVFTVGCAVLTGNSDFAGFAIGTVLFVSILSLGGICGGNFNPCVSVTLGLTKAMGGPGMDWGDVATYVCVQLLAGIIAAGTYTVMLGESVSVAPATGYSIMSAGLCELLYTFMLTFVVLNVAAANKNIKEKNQYYALAIGFTVIAGAYGAGAISGGSSTLQLLLALMSQASAVASATASSTSPSSSAVQHWQPCSSRWCAPRTSEAPGQLLRCI